MRTDYTDAELGSSRTLIAPTLRTPPRTGWRSGVATAFSVALGNPSLWLLGAVGFAARGGVIVMTLVIVILPTPIELRQLLGGYLSSGGLTPAFFGLVLAYAAVGVLIALGGLLVAARTELAAFERYVADPESQDQVHEHPAQARLMAPAGRSRLLAKLLLVQIAAAAALLLAALPLGLSLYAATTEELLRPTPGGGALYLRVLYAVRDPALLLLPALVLIDMFSAMASRRLMVTHVDAATRPQQARSLARAVLDLVGGPLHRPMGAAATSVAVWATTAVVLVPVVWALDIAWDATRAAYLGQRSALDPSALTWLLVMTVLFVLIWGAAVLMAGFASAVRASLWTAESRR
ncbi:hypothetical protein BH23CHL6_BH23CHL6_07600 [soil metagenome]